MLLKNCQTPKDILHFKSECSLLDDDIILVSNRMSKLDYLKKNYNLMNYHWVKKMQQTVFELIINY